jgi:DnaJ-domain-containing protein 1
MSISKRLIDLARSELNSLLEKAARSEDESEDDRRYGGRSSGSGPDLSSMSDEELAAEIERRRRARDERSAHDEVEDAIRGRRRPQQPPPRQPPPRTPRTAAGDDAIRKAYAALEVPPGSDFETVRKSYRRLMRKYHPDLHAGTPDKNRAATDLTQRLTQAYKTLEKHMRR